MFRRYLPLLFVLLVVVATAMLYLLFREPVERQVPPRAGAGSSAVEIVDRTVDLIEFHVESEEEYQRALAALGTSNDEIEAWARSRGFPPATYTSSPGTPLERNYRRERDARLLELAESGDFWAMQFLAARLAPESPLEAAEWYRKAVVRGSAYAAFMLGSLYRDVAQWIAINNDDREQVLEIARREDPLAFTSLAWLLIAEYEAGLPPGAISATLTSFQAPDESIMAACGRAADYLATIVAERAALGIGMSALRPPLAIELPDEETIGYCPIDVFPRSDFSGCATIRLVGDLGSVLGHRCADET
jgi:hypothetical protein